MIAIHNSQPPILTRSAERDLDRNDDSFGADDGPAIPCASELLGGSERVLSSAPFAKISEISSHLASYSEAVR